MVYEKISDLRKVSGREAEIRSTASGREWISRESALYLLERLEATRKDAAEQLKVDQSLIAGYRMEYGFELRQIVGNAIGHLAGYEAQYRNLNDGVADNFREIRVYLRDALNELRERKHADEQRTYPIP